uniref:Pyrrolo-quinoline quinone repeat domain-containing protein n=1 Tax=Fervidobacterium thailandense TaxID=1008305 RepID=A0A7C4GFJ8_9BACT
MKNLEASKAYAWKVAAKDNYGAQTESKLQRFSTVSTGTLKWNFKTRESIGSSPAIGADGTIYVGSWDSYLYALSQDGTLKWRFQTGGGITSGPVLGQDGTIYLGSNDGNLYAIIIDSKGLANSPWPKFRGNFRNTGRFGNN